MSEIIKNEEYATIVINSETYGIHKFIIDIDDVEKCSKHQWCVFNGGRVGYKGKAFYGASNINNKQTLLHRFLLDAKSGFVVDHVNGDTHDNRKQNLRICSKKLNCQNRRNINKNNTSGHKGVTWNKATNCWMAYIHIDNKYKNLGYFQDIKDAIEARKNAEIKVYGEYRSQKKRT